MSFRGNPATRLSALGFAGLISALTFSPDAMALGLGKVEGQATIGSPLRLEIPLLGDGRPTPDISCFKLQRSAADFGDGLWLLKSSLRIVQTPSGDRLVMNGEPVREPFINFAVAVGCGYEIVREYMVLPDAPAELAVRAPVAQAPALPASPARGEAAPPPPLAPLAQMELLRVYSALSLEQLARQRYPEDFAAQEKYLGMMMDANPGLAADALLAAGTELRVPAGLPPRPARPDRRRAEAGQTVPPPPVRKPAPPPKPPVRVAPSAPPPPEAAATPPAPPPAQVAARPATPPPSAPAPAPAPAKEADKLSIGARGDSPEMQNLAELERAIPLMKEQNQLQDALALRHEKLEQDYLDLQQRFAQMEERLMSMNAALIAERQAADSTDLSLLTLVGAVLAGGLTGALALFGLQHLQRRRRGALETISFDDLRS